MNVIRSFITLLIVALIVIAVYGMVWWKNPPAAFADHELGAIVILAALVTSGLIGLWQLWTAPDPFGDSA